MSPEEYNNHNQAKSEISYTVQGINKRLRLGKFCSDRTLITNAAANLSTEPDAALIRWETIESGKVRLVARADETGEYMEIQGSPDWILEVVSKYSVRKDTKVLREKYHRAGVPEYWLVAARERKLDFQILIHKPVGYDLAPARAGWQKSLVFGHWFRLTRKRDRVGLWEYSLHARK